MQLRFKNRSYFQLEVIIADYHTGSSPEDMKGYVIDVKDNFKQIATISVGEAFDIPYTNPKMIFDGEK